MHVTFKPTCSVLRVYYEEYSSVSPNLEKYLQFAVMYKKLNYVII